MITYLVKILNDPTEKPLEEEMNSMDVAGYRLERMEVTPGVSSDGASSFRYTLVFMAKGTPSTLLKTF